MRNDLRVFPRYFLPGGLAALLAQSNASVVDLSIKGARLQVTKQLPIGVKLSFVLMAGGSTIRTFATVLWCQMAALALDQHESDVYLAGVVFDEAVPALAGVIDQLMARDKAMPIQDSRSCERYAVTTPVNAWFGDHAADAQLVDLSLRGARIAIDESARIGRTPSLRFSLENGPMVDLPATVAWCGRSEQTGSYQVGLSITGEETLLGAVIAHLCMRKHARVDLNSLRRKFDPLRAASMSGLVALAG